MLNANAVMLLLLAAGVAVSSAPVLGADVEERTDAMGRRLPGNCQLPVTIRKFSEGHTFPVPGNVIRTSRQDCKLRGGRYLPAPPEAAAAMPG